MTFIKNETSVTIYIEVVSHFRSLELILKPLESGDSDTFEVGSKIHIFSNIGSSVCINMLDRSFQDIWSFGNLFLEEGPKKNSELSLLVKEK